MQVPIRSNDENKSFHSGFSPLSQDCSSVPEDYIGIRVGCVGSCLCFHPLFMQHVRTSLLSSGPWLLAVQITPVSSLFWPQYGYYLFIHSFVCLFVCLFVSWYHIYPGLHKEHSTTPKPFLVEGKFITLPQTHLPGSYSEIRFSFHINWCIKIRESHDPTMFTGAYSCHECGGPGHM